MIFYLCLRILGQYHLEVIDGKLRWFHRNEHGETVFAAETSQSVIDANKWYELAVTYDGASGSAKIYVNSLLVKEESSDPMNLSSDWGLFAGEYNYKNNNKDCNILNCCLLMQLR